MNQRKYTHTLFVACAFALMLGGTLFWRDASIALAAPTFVVNSAADVIAGGVLTNGVCETAPSNGVCTLRAAIMKANHYPGGGVTIDLSVVPGGIVTLTIPSSGSDDETNGDLNITSTMSIVGLNSSTTIVDGNASVTNDRVFNVGVGGTAVISNLTIRNGNTTDNGGGIFKYGALTLTNSIVTGNTSAAASGGGIFNWSGPLTVTNSTISGNNSASGGGGIGINADTFITNSTISGNTASTDGGGIWSNNGTLTMINSTISGNNSKLDGGGIRGESGTTFNLFNVTISNNQADSDFNGTGKGGGVSLSTLTNGFNFRNSIIGINYESVHIITWIQWDSDCAGPITSLGNNIVNAVDSSNCTVTGAYTLANPKVGPLQNNGGPTKTHALQIGSPAIDAGNAGGCVDNFGATLTTDQRGWKRPIGLRCDIGAYEFPIQLFLPLILR